MEWEPDDAAEPSAYVEFHADGMRRLAEAVVMCACLDYLATRCPESAERYLRRWRGVMETSGHTAKEAVLELSLAEWTRCEQQQLKEAFAGGLRELAHAVGKDAWVDRVMHAPLDPDRVRDCLNGTIHYPRAQFKRDPQSLLERRLPKHRTPPHQRDRLT